MARDILVSLNLNGNEIQNAIVQNLASQPLSPKKGQLYFNSTKNTIEFYDGTDWVDTKTADLTSREAIELINGNASELKIDRNQIAGLQEAFENVSMSGTDIITAINDIATTGKIDLSKIAGVNEALAQKEDKGTAKQLADTAETNAKRYSDSKVTELLNTIKGGAGEAYDTFGEIEQFIKDHRSDIDKLLKGLKPYVETVGDGVMTEYVVTHNLNNEHPHVNVYLGKELVEVDVEKREHLCTLDGNINWTVTDRKSVV